MKQGSAVLLTSFKSYNLSSYYYNEGYNIFGFIFVPSLSLKYIGYNNNIKRYYRGG